MRNYIRILPFILIGCIVFISIGFSSFSSNLGINDIKASVRPTKNIRVTKFYASQNENGGSSYWEEFSSDKIITDLVLPNANSSIIYTIEVTNLDNEMMMIDSISGLPDDIEYSLIDYTLYDKICDNNNANNCTLGAKRVFQIVLENKTGHLLDSRQVVSMDINFVAYSYSIVFNANGGSGTMNPISVKYDVTTNLPSCMFHRIGYKFVGWNTADDGTGTSYSNQQSIQNINNGEPSVTLYAQWIESGDSVYYPGVCTFSGQGHALEGSCADDNNYDYINTGIAPFSQENFEKNFLLTLTINSIDDTLFNSNSRATIFNMLYEANDEIGKWPGVVLRTDNGKWLLQGSRGIDPDYANKVNLQKTDLLGKELRIIRHNDGSTIKIYYVIDGQGPYLLKDITDMPHPFDTILSFGAGIDYDNVTPWRYAKADVSDISFEFYPDGTTLSELTGIPDEPPDEGDMQTVFYQQGKCEFHGSTSYITGTACTDYQNEYMINTGIQLFSTTNLSQDFDLSFKIDHYATGDQPEAQVTIFNAFIERTSAGYGMLLRRNSGNLQFIIRDGNGINKTVTINSNNLSTLRIIKKGNDVCYSVNGGIFKHVINLQNFSAPLTVPVTFGGSIDKNGNPFRYIVGELSEMKIDIGRFGSDVQCDESMQ